jgi:hypothetical protein
MEKLGPLPAVLDVDVLVDHAAFERARPVEGVDGNDVGAFFDEWEGGGGCADANQDGGIDGSDIEAFFVDWQDSAGHSDVNQDGGVDGSDIEAFFMQWETGTC